MNAATANINAVETISAMSIAARLEKSISEIIDKLKAPIARVKRLFLFIFSECGKMRSPKRAIRPRRFLIEELSFTYQSLMIFAIVAIAASVTATFSIISSTSTFSHLP